jgi:catechol 2,3-dioxygenase-like lactoylglutathione lyase family enzyme
MRGSIEIVVVPVSDADRAKAFWVDRLGFRLDQDSVVPSGQRFVQVTPEGSSCSLSFGSGLSPMEPGTLRAAMIVVDDVDAARAELAAAGAEPTEVEEQPWGRFVYFQDPDGNRFWLQEPPRCAG